MEVEIDIEIEIEMEKQSLWQPTCMQLRPLLGLQLCKPTAVQQHSSTVNHRLYRERRGMKGAGANADGRMRSSSSAAQEARTEEGWRRARAAH